MFCWRVWEAKEASGLMTVANWSRGPWKWGALRVPSFFSSSSTLLFFFMLTSPLIASSCFLFLFYFSFASIMAFLHFSWSPLMTWDMLRHYPLSDQCALSLCRRHQKTLCHIIYISLCLELVDHIADHTPNLHHLSFVSEVEVYLLLDCPFFLKLKYQ